MAKKIKCPRCKIDYDPVMTLDGDVVCPHCDNIEFIDSSTIDSTHFYLQQQQILKALDDQLQAVEHPVKLFITALIGQDNLAEDLLKNPAISPPLVERWWYYEFLLERIFFLKLDLSSDSLEESFVPSKATYEYLEPYVKEGIRAYRFIQDYQSGNILFGYLQENPQEYMVYLTAKKWLWSTSKKIALEILTKHPDSHPHLLMDFRGLTASIFSPQDPRLQQLNAGARIWTNLLQYSSADNFFKNLNSKHEDEFLSLLQSLEQTFPGKEFEENVEEEETYKDYWHYISPGVLQIFREALVLSSPIFMAFYSWSQSGQDFLDPSRFPSPVKGEELINEFLKFFSQHGAFRSIFFPVDKTIFFSVHNVKLFRLLLANYMLIQKTGTHAARKEVAAYRSRQMHEPSCWHLGMHLNIQTIFPDGTPMMCLNDIQGDQGGLEVDVLYYLGTTLAIIECKSDIAITPQIQEGYYQKLLNKIPFVRKYCENRGLVISDVRPQILCYVCGKKPLPEIDVFISEMQFLEYYVNQSGLFRWPGEKLFEQYPILAKIAWINIGYLRAYPIRLNNILGDSLFLINAHYKDGTILFTCPNSNKTFTCPVENMGDEIEWDRIEVLVLWDDGVHSVRDHLFLPPYLFEAYSADDEVYEAWIFHNSMQGQRFLYCASLDGVFGFCEDCKVFPLIPRGGNANKPGRSHAKAVCPKCHKEQDLHRFDGVCFAQYPELENKIEQVIQFKFGLK